MDIDLTQLNVQELMRLEGAVVAELRRRELVRTNNKPLGDVAELLVHRARGGVLEPNSTKSHDVTAANGRRIQVKAMTRRAAGRAGKFSPFRSFDFDSAVFLLFDAATFDLIASYEATPDQIQGLARFSAHTNGAQPTLAQIEKIGTDVHSEMLAAYDRLIDEG